MPFENFQRKFSQFKETNNIALDLRYAANDLTAELPQYDSMRDRICDVLAQVDVNKRVAALRDIEQYASTLPVDFLQKSKLVVEESLNRSQFARHFHTTYGVDTKMISSWVLKPLRLRGAVRQFDFSRLLTSQVLKMLAADGTPDSGAQEYLAQLDQTQREQLLSTVLQGSYDEFSSEHPNPLGKSFAIKLEKSGSYLAWMQAQQCATKILEGTLSLSELPDIQLVPLTILLKSYGYLEPSHPASQFLTRSLAGVVQPHHPALLQLIKQEVGQFKSLDSDKLQQLKRVYEHYAVYAMHVQEMVENGRTSSIFEEDQRRKVYKFHRVSPATLAGTSLRSPSVTRSQQVMTLHTSPEQQELLEAQAHGEQGGMLSSEKKTQLRQSELMRVMRQRQSEDAFRMLQLARAKRSFSRNAATARAAYGMEVRIHDTIVAREMINKASSLPLAVANEATVEQMYDLFSSFNIFVNRGVSKLETVVLVCLRLMEFVELSNSNHRTFVSLFQQKVLKIFREYHDELGVERMAALEAVASETYEVCETRSQPLVASFNAATHGLTDVFSTESEEQRNKLVRLINKHRPPVEWFVQSVSNQLGKNTLFRKDHWRQASVKLSALVGSAIFGVLCAKGGIHERFFYNFVKSLTDFSSSNSEVRHLAYFNALATTLLLVFETAAAAELVLAVVQSDRMSLITKLLDNVSVRVEEHYQQMQKHSAEVSKKSISNLVQFSLLFTLAFSLGTNYQRVLDTIGDAWSQFTTEPELGGGQSDTIPEFGNISEAPQLGEPTFYAYGIENYPNTFWVNRMCGLAENGVVACGNILPSNSMQVEFKQTTPITSHSSSNDKYSSAQDREKRVQELVDLGYIVRFNVNMRDPFFGTPSGGFKPVGVLAHQDDPAYNFSYQPGAGVLLYAKDSRPNTPLTNRFPIGVVYAPQPEFEQPLSEREYIVKDFPRSLEYGSKVALGYDNTDMIFLDQDLNTWWRSGLEGSLPVSASALVPAVSVDAIRPVDLLEMTDEYRQNTSVLFSAVVYTEHLREYSILSHLQLARETQAGATELIDEPTKVMEMINNWGYVIVPGTLNGALDSTKAYVLIIGPNSDAGVLQRDFFATSEGNVGYMRIARKNKVEGPPFSESSEVMPSDPVGVVLLNGLDVFSEPLVNQPRSTILSSELLLSEGRTYQPLRAVETTLFFANDVADPVSTAFDVITRNRADFTNLEIARGMYQAMLASGYEYGFEKYNPPGDWPALSVFIDQMSVDQNEKPVHPEQICQQFALDLFFMIKLIDYTIPAKLVEGYIQQNNTQFGGNASAAHMVLAIGDEKTGNWVLFDATLPDINGDASDYPRLPAENEGGNDSDSAFPLSLLVGSTAGLIYAILKVSRALRSVPKSREQSDLVGDEMDKNVLYDQLVLLFSELSPQEMIATYYALLAAFGPRLADKKMNASEPETQGAQSLDRQQKLGVRSAFTGEFKIFAAANFVPVNSWSDYDTNLQVVAGHIQSLAEGKTTLFNLESTTHETAQLLQWIRQRGGRVAPWRSAIVATYFDRYFSRNFQQPIAKDGADEKTVLSYSLRNVRHLARMLTDSAPVVARTLLRVHDLAVARSTIRFETDE